MSNTWIKRQNEEGDIQTGRKTGKKRMPVGFMKCEGNSWGVDVDVVLE